MHGIIFDIKRFAVHDGPGIRTTIFFKGCPLKCYWCHNPESRDENPVEIIKSVKMEGKIFNCKETTGQKISLDELMNEIRRDRIFMDESGGGVTFSGGEPTMQFSFLYELLKSCTQEDIHTAVDTSGYCEKLVLEKLLPVTNLFLFDIKHADPEIHLKSTGASNVLIIENLKFLIESKKSVYIRIPVIPDFNFNEKDLKKIMDLILPYESGIKQVNLLPYHFLAENKYKKLGMKSNMNHKKSLKTEDVEWAKVLFEKEGFNVKIGG